MLVAGEFWMVSVGDDADGGRRVDELLLGLRRRDDDLLLVGRRPGWRSDRLSRLLWLVAMAGPPCPGRVQAQQMRDEADCGETHDHRESSSDVVSE